MDIKLEAEEYFEEDEEEKVKRIRVDPMLTHSYVYTIWNNKGGVGKSTLTFHIASIYAKTHPGRYISIFTSVVACDPKTKDFVDELYSIFYTGEFW